MAWGGPVRAASATGVRRILANPNSGLGKKDSQFRAKGVFGNFSKPSIAGALRLVEREHRILKKKKQSPDLAKHYDFFPRESPWVQDSS